MPKKRVSAGPRTYFTIEELSDYINVPVQTLRHWRKRWDRDHRGPAGFLMEGSLRYEKVTVDAWLAMMKAREHGVDGAA